MRINKKVRKLLRDPRQFFKDMAAKRRSRLIASAPPAPRQARAGNFRYTVVAAVYNVDRYLDHYLRTLTRQTLDFKSHIRLVLVDDGSTDGSREVIARWQTRFPDNILYLHKANGGQASARNLGLSHVETDYVTFIDPDDFVAPDYFMAVDQFLGTYRGKSVRMVGCNLIFYREANGVIVDNHPLKYRFAKGDVLVKLDALGKHLQLSAATAFFDADILARSGLRFDERIRPSFEDAHFVERFLAMAGEGHAAFLKSAKYYYRKRGDGTSSLDGVWSNPSYFDEVLRHGCLDLFDFYRRAFLGAIPIHAQRAVLYHTAWQVKEIVNRPERLEFLSESQRKNFLYLLEEVFASIDASTILEFELAGIWFFHKVGLLHCFKREKPPFQIVYVDRYDSVKRQVLLVYYTGEVSTEEYLIDGNDVPPTCTKTARHDFSGRTFTLARHVWLPLNDASQDAELRIHIGGRSQDTRITLAGTQHRGGLSIAKIEENFNVAPAQRPQQWLLMDRENRADDNAEHLYRHIRHSHPEQDMRFVLRRESHDWARLESEGFRLLAYASSEHEAALRSCGKIVSSHIDRNIEDYFGDGSLRKKSIVFLQHGVIHNDLSAWLNQKKIDCLITSSEAEFDAVAGDGNRYRLTPKEVALTGLARHDTLLDRQRKLPTERLILVAPTWRGTLQGGPGGGRQRGRNPEFMASRYATAWRAFLCSPELKDLSRQFGYRIEFLPHANVQAYLGEFDLPPHIGVASNEHGSIQEWLCRAALMVTDFSSVAFDVAFLGKPVIYFQFDQEDFFNGGHFWQRGYFNYGRDGLGPVCITESELLDALAHLLAQECRPGSAYLERIDRFFAFRDGNNCERIYQAIRALDSAGPDPVLARTAKREHARSAELAGDWPLAERGWRQFLASEVSLSARAEVQRHLAEALSRQSPTLLQDIQAGAALLQAGTPSEADGAGS